MSAATAGRGSEAPDRSFRAGRARTLGHRLAGATLVIGLAISAAVAGLQLLLMYRAEIAITEQRLDGIGQALVPGLTRSLWYVDEAQVEILLEGVFQVPGVEYVRLEDREGVRHERGTAPDAPVLVRDFPLRYADGESFDVGTLHVEVGRLRIDDRLLTQALRQAALTTVLLMGTAFLVLLLFRQWVTRHLAAMADYTSQLRFDRLEEGGPLTLADKPVRDPPDELDRVAGALNDMRERMIQFLDLRDAYEQALEEHRDRLESLVEERTAELVRKAELLEQAHRAESVARGESARSEARLRLITDNMPALISRIGPDGRFLFNNKAYERWLERPLSEITGQPLEHIYTPEQYAQIAPHLQTAFAGQMVTFEMFTGRRHVRATYVPEIDAEGRVESVFGLVHDITRIKQIEQELRALAQFDALTGLPNRRRLEERLQEAIARAERSGQGLALMFLDIDRFKGINDTLGHQAGDLVLQEFAARLTACVRQTDTVARLAGDEFVIVLEALETAEAAAQAEAVARKILQAMAPVMQIDANAVALSTSIGIALHVRGEQDGPALLQRADAALYAAKRAGRGIWRFAQETDAG